MTTGDANPRLYRAADGPARGMTPEEALWVAVLERAVLDAHRCSVYDGGDDAWSFLTDRAGGWAVSREDICNAIGIDPDRLREDVLRGIEPPEDRRRKGFRAKPGRPGRVGAPRVSPKS